MAQKKKTERTRAHPRFGEIPMLPVKHTAPSGRDDSYWRYDLDYAPPMPAGAVRGDPKRQAFCPMCHVPKYFFVDEEKTCVECGGRFTFGAAEQKLWYEDLGFNFHSTAVRCLECRRDIRSGKSLQRQLAAAVRLANAKLDDPLALLALVEASLAYFDRFQRVDLDRALAAARKAGKLSKELWETIYWEARCHEAAGRTSKAQTLYRDFLELAKTRVRYKNLAKDVEKRLR